MLTYIMRNGVSNPRLRSLPRLCLVGASALALAGCDTNELVAVTDPNQLRPDDLNNAGAIPALVQGAVRQFVGGYSGFGLDDSFLSMTAVLTDEFYWGDTFTTRVAADARSLQPTSLGNISDPSFSRLQQARINARRTFAQITTFTTAATAAADVARQTLLRAIEGYVYVTVSEGWCGSVPFSVVPETGSIDPSLIEEGEPIGTIAMNDTAVVRFDQALALTSTSNLAKVGKGRALVNAARFADAAAAVATVPTTFVHHLEHSSNAGSENNPINSLQGNGRYGISNLEGGTTATGAALRPDTSTATSNATAEGLAFRGSADPRIPHQLRGTSGACFTSSVRCWLNNNYPNFDADVPLASGVEARLIEAEAALHAGDVALMLSKLNELRASTTSLLARLYPTQQQTFFDAGAPRGLAPLTDPANPAGTAAEQFAARRDLVFRERAFWLFNTGHRLGDLRRLARAPYSRPTTAVFPTGPYFRGGTYGDDVAYPVPFNEQNNPKFNPASCSTTTP